MNLRTNGPLDKRVYETLWARHMAATTLTQADHKTWLSYRSVDKIYLGSSDRLVVWQRIAGRNQAVKHLRFVGMELCGGELTYTFSCDKTTFVVDHFPKWFSDLQVFLWIPHFNEMRNQPDDWNHPDEPFHLTFGLSLWQKSNPVKEVVSGHSYCTTERTFLNQWASTQHLGA